MVLNCQYLILINKMSVWISVRAKLVVLFIFNLFVNQIYFLLSILCVQVDVDIATHISISDDGPNRRYMFFSWHVLHLNSDQSL